MAPQKTLAWKQGIVQLYAHNEHPIILDKKALSLSNWITTKKEDTTRHVQL